MLWVGWLYSAHATIGVGDEGVYLYDAALWAKAGKLPYRDVFLAHPPIRVALAALAHGAGLPLVVGKWFAIAATLGSGALAALCAQRIAGPIAAVVAAGCWFASPLVLETGGALIGPDLTTMVMLAALLAGLHGAWRSAGLLVATSALTALYGLLVLPVLVLLVWTTPRSGAAWRFAQGLAALPLALLALQLATDGAFLDQTVWFQLGKVQASSATSTAAAAAWPWQRMLGAMRGEATLLALALMALPLLRRPRTPGAMVAAGAWLSLLPVLAYRSFAPYYLVGPLGLLAVAAGVGVAGLLRPAPSQPAVTSAQPSTTARRPALLLAAVAALWALGALPAYGAAIARRSMQPVVDAELTIIAERIARHRPKSAQVWGDTAVTPILALRTDLAITADQVDTNDKRFFAGSLDTADVIATLQRERPAILLIPQHGPFRVAALRSWIEQHYRAVFWHRGIAIGYDVVYLLPADEAPAQAATPAAAGAAFDSPGTAAPP